MKSSAHDYLLSAQAEIATGRVVEAEAILAEGLSAHPDQAELNAAAASLALKNGNPGRAVALYQRALELSPQNREWPLDLAIALTASGNPQEAIAKLVELEPAWAIAARYWSIRANAALQNGNMEEAASSYDRCLELEPSHARALHGRARVALNRGEDEAVRSFDRALAARPGEADLWLGKAQALDAGGKSEEALELIAGITAQAPHWIDGLQLQAQLRQNCRMGETDRPFVEAAALDPANPAIPAAHIGLLARIGNHAEATEVARQAAERFRDASFFDLAAATNAGMAGDLQLADSLFAGLSVEGPDRWLQEGRHRIRRGDLEEAERLLTRACDDTGTAHTAWALLGIVWRLRDDPKADWLHGQEGMVRLLDLGASEDLLSPLGHELERIHDISSFPLGQSLRGGTQTRHILFQRKEPVLAELRAVIKNALENYRSGLPPVDPDHPMLQYRDAPWALAGSWSVRLSGGGDHHASHIHPQGLVSSALYLVLPQPAEGEGYLEIGRPPPDLGLDLGPLHVIKPRPAHLALFPSTLFHGTTSFSTGTRMTVAFDVATPMMPRHE